jgi:hypothetical protein
MKTDNTNTTSLFLIRFHPFSSVAKGFDLPSKLHRIHIVIQSETALSPSPRGLIPIRISILFAFRIHSADCLLLGLDTSTKLSRENTVQRLRHCHRRFPPLPRTIQNPALCR